ncbi:aminotransferase class I/II-fold pyridoxal phosphate-dependent enzyme, partial [Escherichia coli]|nr:aminotransferase class I/II-fold pyridoxal phosphate-dependent enzyme [Escherichia coli]
WHMGHRDSSTNRSERYLTNGIWVTAIRPPTVPKGTSRLRITLTANHSTEQVKTLSIALKQALGAL